MCVCVCVCAHTHTFSISALIFNLSPINLAELISRCAQPFLLPHTHTPRDTRHSQT